MSGLGEVLVESFRLLLDMPAIFVPKLVSTAAGALWFIGLVSGFGQRYFYVLTAPILLFLGVFVSVMLAGMVKESDSRLVLKRGFLEAIGSWRKILFSSLALLLLGLLVYVPLGLGFLLYLIFGQFVLFLAGVLLSLSLVFLLAFLLYFFPISLLENGSVLEGLSDSVRTSLGNSREVVVLTVFSFVLLGLASLPGQGLEVWGYIAFFALRMISGIVTTYIFVVSPKYYIEN